MAFGGWKLIVEVCLPIPFVLLILLSLPAHRVFHRGVLHVVDKTLGLRVVGALSLLHFMLIVTGAALAATIKTTHTLSLLRMDPAQQTPNLLSQNLGKRWRAERNFWISFLCFTLWCLLARVYQILKAKVALEDELASLKRVSAGPSAPAATPSRPVTRSGAAAATGPPISAPTKPAEMADTRKSK
ncbi:hypothetical protein WJX81_000918 [Elliptochloris bilobata]|uniref:BAP29/BAP31 transmembrane domain-containing protein n=1 Tax=Elliptochloris bilobata TaxID=381761 RepID=A0AAW1SDT4_9CHLO